MTLVLQMVRLGYVVLIPAEREYVVWVEGEKGFALNGTM